MSTMTIRPVGQPDATPTYLARPALAVISALFCGYLAVGLPLPVIPLFPDQQSGKQAAVQGAGFCAVGGVLYVIAALPGISSGLSLGIVVAGRLAVGATSYVSPAGHRLPFHRVIGQIWREGLGLMLQGVGLSGLTAFASLYFAARGWTHAGWVVTAFGVGFIFVRVVWGHLPDRIGGFRVALWSLLIEAIGQAMVWRAPQELVALSRALVTALLDIAYGLAGPGAGLVAGQFGYAAVYLIGTASALVGAALVIASRSTSA